MVYILFAIGFLLLIKGADWLVDGSAALAKRFRVSDMLIGLTIVSVGTSAPELIVNVIASIKGNAGIAIGNIFGSNIANVFLILGITALIFPIPIRKDTVRTDIPFVIIATLLVGFLANAHISGFSDQNTSDELYINFWDGIILLFFFAIFLSYAIKMSKKTQIQAETYTQKPLINSVLLILIGITGLFFGGKWVVEGAVSIAKLLNMSDSFIGLSIVALGTSLPELTTSIIAAKKRNLDIAVGNIIGSNIFNLLWVIGISAVINPLKFEVVNNTDILIMLLSSVAILFAVSIEKKITVNRISGLIFVLIYISYIVFIIYRG